MTLAVSAAEAMIAHARREAPRECCGILVGAGDTILEAVPSRNLSPDPTRRFLLDPQAHITARRDARERRLEVLGFYHSHPHSPAQPSARDAAEASYDGLYAIVSLAGDDPDVRLFRYAGGAFDEIDAATGRRRARRAGA